jgi:hypothetical protein
MYAHYKPPNFGMKFPKDIKINAFVDWAGH